MKSLLFSCLFCSLLACSASLTAAQELLYPIDVAVSKDSTVYIADLRLPGLWKYSEGKLSVVFQAENKLKSPLSAVRCVAVDDEGRLFAGDSATREIYRIDGPESLSPLTNGRIGVPIDLVIRGDDLYASDLEYRQIVRVPAQGGEPETLAKNLIARGLAPADDETLFFLGNTEQPLGRLNAAGEVTLLVEGQPFQFAHQLAVLDSALYVTDNYAATIWKCGTEAGGTPEAFVSGDPLVRPVGICTNGEKLFVADPRAQDVFVISPDGTIQSLTAGSSAE
ncbi:hypothetical protein [Rubinisphaera margarita]|uniref:hypothetical protein n=1 Tax=Rubinisphaera margarita TaxID=2909586 RepID=UPI001EE7EA7B|nr:hypothetical protein [Rubinisphaera margarita]MCG6158255.1 hypothetical protein [Rubinisphaera margarita]